MHNVARVLENDFSITTILQEYNVDSSISIANSQGGVGDFIQETNKACKSTGGAALDGTT